MRRSDDVAEVFDSPRTQQDFPVITSGMQGESGGHHQDLRSLQRQRAEEFRETQVVAHGQAKSDPIYFGGHDFITGRDTLRLVVLLAISQVYIEEMDFAITSDNFTAAVDKNGGIIELSVQVGDPFDDTAAMDDHPVLAGLFL